MRNTWRIIHLICLAIPVLSIGSAHGQSIGSVVGWGEQVVVAQADLRSLVAVAGGAAHSLGLKSDGTIVAWG